MSNTSLSHRYSFSGSDTKVFGYYTGGSKYHLEAMHTLSCSVYEAKGRVRSLGFKSIRGFSRAVREISGTMIMLVVGGHPLRPLMDANPYASSIYYGEADSRSWSIDATRTARGSSSLYQYGEDEGYFSERDTTRIPTTLPPFNLLVHFQSEIPVGSFIRGDEEEKVSNAAFELIDVEIMGEGIVTSVNDMVTEIQYQFVARDYKEYALNIESDPASLGELDLLKKAEMESWIDLQKRIGRLGGKAFQYESGDVEISQIINGSDSSPFLKEILRRSNAYSSGDISYGSIPAKNEDLSFSNAVQNNQIDTIGVGDTIPIMAPSAEKAQDIIAQNSDPSNEELSKIVKDEIITLEGEVIEANTALAKATTEKEAEKAEAEKRKAEAELIAKQAEAEAIRIKKEEEEAKRLAAAEAKAAAEAQAELDRQELEMEAAMDAYFEWKDSWDRNKEAADIETNNRNTQINELNSQIQDLSKPEAIEELSIDVSVSEYEVKMAEEALEMFLLQHPDPLETYETWEQHKQLTEDLDGWRKELQRSKQAQEDYLKNLDTLNNQLDSLQNENAVWGNGSLNVIDPSGNMVTGSSFDKNEHGESLEFYQVVDYIAAREQEQGAAVDFLREVETGHPWSGLKIPGTNKNIDYYEIQRTNQGTLVKLYTKSSYNSYNYLVNANVPQTFNSLYILMGQ